MNEIVLTNHTQAFLDALLSSSPDVRAKIVTEDGVVIRDSDDLQTIKINDSLFSDTFIGTFQKTSCEIQMLNYDAKYNLLNKNFNIYLGFGYYVDDVYTIEYEDMGTYVCYETSDYKTEIELNIKAYNLSYLFETKYVSDLAYPCTVADYIQDICNLVGVELATTSFVNSTLPLTEAPYLEEGATFRDAVAMVAEASGGFAKVRHDNKLYIEFFDDTDIQEVGDYSDLKQEALIGPYNIVVLGRTPQEDNVAYPTTIPADPVEYRIDNNQILDSIREVAIIPIYNLVNGFTYYPIEIEVVGNMLVQAGKYIKYYDLEENEINNPVFDHILEYNGGLVSTYKTYQKSATSTDYKYAGSIEKRVTNTEIIVDKNSNDITSLVEVTTELGENISQLQQDISGFEFKIQESGNLNLISNSVGWNDTKFWTLSGAGTVIADQDAEVRDNSNSKSGFKLNNITMSQTIDVIPNNQYSISAILKNVVSNSAYLKVINGTEEIIVFNDEIELDFVRYDNTFIANTNQITVQVYSSGDNLIVTDLVIASGDLIKTWFPGSNEIYTSNVKIDKDGISITNSVSGTKTVIDSSEFAIYAGSNKTIAVNKDLTTLRKTEILDTLTLGKLRFDKKTDGVDLAILD